MNDRERFIACILGEPLDRPPYWLYWSPWGSTWRRWEREGKPASISDHRMAFAPDVRPNSIPVNCGPCPKLEKTIIEESDDYVVFTDTWGILRRDYRHGESMSEFLRFPVRSREDWTRFRDAYLNPDDPRRLDGDWREKCAAWTATGQPIQLGYYPDVGIFGPVRWLLGDEDGLIAFVAEPDLAHEIMEHLTSLYLAVFEKVAQEVRVDVIHLWKDMCSHSRAAHLAPAVGAE